jgi:hypothetical protein
MIVMEGRAPRTNQQWYLKCTIVNTTITVLAFNPPHTQTSQDLVGELSEGSKSEAVNSRVQGISVDETIRYVLLTVNLIQ